MYTATLYYTASSNDTNFLYRFGHYEIDPVIFIDKGGERHVVVRDFEVDRLGEDANFHTVWPYSEVERWALEHRLPHGCVGVILALLQKLGVSTVHVPNNFQAALYLALQDAGLTLVLDPDPFLPQRMIKSKEEIEKIKVPQHALNKVFAEVKEILTNASIHNNELYLGQETLTSERMRYEIDRMLLQYDCVAEATIVACGNQATQPHCKGTGPLRPDVPIIVDIFPKSRATHYYADMTRTFLKGKPTPYLSRMYDAVKRAHQNGLSCLKNGVNGQDVHRAVQATLSNDGFETIGNDGFIHGTGHGVGLDIHEPPSISTKAWTLKSGNVVTVEPGLYYKGIGGIRLEDMVVITDDGYINLTEYPMDFVIP